MRHRRHRRPSRCDGASSAVISWRDHMSPDHCSDTKESRSKTRLSVTRGARRIRPCWSASAYMNTSIVKQEERCSETADMASKVRENALEWVHVVRALRQEIVGGADTRCNFNLAQNR